MTKSLNPRCNLISQRWVFAILASIGLCLQNIFSVIMSITIIEIVEKTESGVSDSKSCPSIDIGYLANNTYVNSQLEYNSTIQRYPWDEYTQGVILSSFSWSCMIATFFHGTLAEQFGGKSILGFSILAQAAITFITPYLINLGGYTALIISRVLIGLGSDGMYPVVNVMIPQWSTQNERTKISNVIFAGPVLGLFFGTIMPALIITYSNIGWPAVFYTSGVIGILWFPFWQIYVYNSPEEHPFISDKEFKHLHNTYDVEIVSDKVQTVPWKHLFLCREFWAYTIAYIGANCTYYLMLSDLPNYMANLVTFPIESNGYFSSLPYIFMWLNSLFSAWLCDKILEKQLMSLTNVRKLLTTLSVVGPAIFLLLASYAECNKTMVVLMFVIGLTLSGGTFTSLFMNPIDLSPRYAGSITSVGTGISLSVGILAPYLVGVLVPNSTIDEWRLVFWMVLICASLSIFVYIFWFKAEVQLWDDPEFLKKKIGNVQEKEVELKLMS